MVRTHTASLGVVPEKKKIPQVPYIKKEKARNEATWTNSETEKGRVNKATEKGIVYEVLWKNEIMRMRHDHAQKWSRVAQT